ncbi:uncharacterized protein K02A2.6-like [Rhagoletis pomonella]|uniref:uncharacterized protein K02A2.6-like n=1 Tax=Rhagoletis pomonella TaxID=28610 RepID=UPI0017851B30|nr:uncharacterized protein K02A2.6-like [Rhagoletis pomonella]
MKESKRAVVNKVYASRSRSSNRADSKWKRSNISRGSPEKALKSCIGCGTSHSRNVCIYFKRKTKCNSCSRPGHISSVCKSTEKRKTSNSKQVNVVNDISQRTFENISVVNVVNTSGTDKKIEVKLHVNGKSLSFQVDTGASCSLVGIDGYKMLGKPKCVCTSKVLKTYGGHQLPLKGITMVNVHCNNIHETLPLVVVDNKEASHILGLDWFHELRFHIDIPSNLEANQCFSSSTEPRSSSQLAKSLEGLTKEYHTLFAGGLALCSTFKAEINLKAGTKPKFSKPYNLPFAFHDEVLAELNRLVSTNVLQPIKASEWAAPIVVIRKQGGKIRVCADFKYQMMPFGIFSAPGIFQRFMEQLIAGIPGCAVYLDDVIVTGENDENHVANVRRIFQRLEENGLRCRPEKCTFVSQQIEYAGHIIDGNGIKPSTKRLEAIRMMSRHKNVHEVEAFIGKINYYNKFIPNFSAKATALNILRRQGQKFEWSEAQDTAFTALKDDIITATQIVHHNDKLPIILATDASKYGLGVVISHRYPDGSENPIAFASKTLNKSQINYSQVEKEALSIVFGVTRFHQYLYGHALSRLPMGEDLEFDYWENKILNVYEVNETALDTFPISSSTISKETEKDVQLQVVKRMIQDGWPHHLPESHERRDIVSNRAQSSGCPSNVAAKSPSYAS